ncbi:carbohydrate ABC transporter permease [Paenibacillus contaminans]|uniref:Carbohydrate ABC transporter permease n=1 Tax=Paenibacillus contaminans TaxID=450362 RepID=A0A329MEU8_9BACL|nr:carbohydrate ABC transporter permease [Paenibacillus contaminans]RAV15627.1 carbohydrate ABC transporter permease [Paenibacillus contaminans]
MNYRLSAGRRLFLVSNYMFLTLLAFACLFPLLHVFALSLSSSHAVTAGKVWLIPVDFTLSSYKIVLSQKSFFVSFWISVKRVILGTSISMLLAVLAAYPLSRDQAQFRPRTVYAWFFVLSTMFSGGLIPLFMIVKSTHLLDTIWALVIPGAVNVFNIILLLNFFRSLPKELDDAAKIDGAGHLASLFRIYIPLSLASLATLTVFTVVGHWNSWFDGLIFMNSPDRYPLQSFLQTIVIKQDVSKLDYRQIEALSEVSARTNKAAQIFVATIPILLVYPFLQRYFVSGIVLGSVKE